MHDASPLGIQELARPFDGADIDAAGNHWSAAMTFSGHQAAGQFKDEAVCGQWFEGTPKGLVDRARQGQVCRHGFAHERQRVRLAAQGSYGFHQSAGIHVDDVIPETLGGARAPIVRLVWVERDHLSRGAGTGRSPVVEDLDSGMGQPNGIGLMAMPLVGPAGKPRAE
jgi:hypothetical protein